MYCYTFLIIQIQISRLHGLRFVQNAPREQNNRNMYLSWEKGANDAKISIKIL